MPDLLSRRVLRVGRLMQRGKRRLRFGRNLSLKLGAAVREHEVLPERRFFQIFKETGF